MDRFDKDISFLVSFDRDPMLKELCRQYSIDSFDEKFRVITFPISDLIKRNYEAGYFLSNYPYVLSLYGVRDEQMDNLSTEELPYLATLACLTWHFRRDYFCQGTLSYRSIAEGTLLRLFCHLRELYKKNPTVSTLEELHRTKCSSLPCQPGIYRVLAPEKLPISFIEGSDNLRAKGYPAAGAAICKIRLGHRCQPQGWARHLAGEGLSAPAVRVRSLRKLRAEGARAVGRL